MTLAVCLTGENPFDPLDQAPPQTKKQKRSKERSRANATPQTAQSDKTKISIATEWREEGVVKAILHEEVRLGGSVYRGQR